MNHINCGAIAAHVLIGLAQPKQERERLLSTGIAEYMGHEQSKSGVNDATPHSVCRRWRFQHALRLLDWAFAQLEQGQANLAFMDQGIFIEESENA